MIKYSVIIPMFNSENFIERAINSIIVQNFSEYEIILINDGSEDNTKQKCQKYLCKNIRLINFRKNHGVAFARNAGLKFANGKYIIFLDSDDWFENNTFSIIDQSLKNCDLLIFGTNYYRKNITEKQQLPAQGIFSTKELYNNLSLLLNVSTLHWITNKVFKSDIIKKNLIKFNTKIKMGEDLDFCIRYIEKTTKVKFVNYYLYNYDRTNNDSLTNLNLLSLPERTQFNTQNIKKFLIKNNICLTGFNDYENDLYNYVKMKINRSSYSTEIKKNLLLKNDLLNKIKKEKHENNNIRKKI